MHVADHPKHHERLKHSTSYSMMETL